MSVTLGTIDIELDGGQDSNGNPQRLRPPITTRAENVDYINDAAVHVADQIGKPIEGFELITASFEKLNPYLSSGATQSLPIMATTTRTEVDLIANTDNGLKAISTSLDKSNQPWDIGEALATIGLPISDVSNAVFSGAFNDNGDYCIAVRTSAGLFVYIADSETLQFRLTFSTVSSYFYHAVVGGGPACPNCFTIFTQTGFISSDIRYSSFTASTTVWPTPVLFGIGFTEFPTNIVRIQGSNRLYIVLGGSSGHRLYEFTYTNNVGSLNIRLVTPLGAGVFGKYIAIDLNQFQYPYIVVIGSIASVWSAITYNLNTLVTSVYNSSTFNNVVAVGMVNGNVYVTVADSTLTSGPSGLATSYVRETLTSFHITGMPAGVPVLAKTNEIRLPMGIGVNSLGFCVPSLSTNPDGTTAAEHDWYLTCVDLNNYLSAVAALAAGAVGNTPDLAGATPTTARRASQYIYNAFTGVCVSRSWTNNSYVLNTTPISPKYLLSATPYFYNPSRSNLAEWTVLQFGLTQASILTQNSLNLTVTRVSKLAGAGNAASSLVGNQVYLPGANRSQTDGQVIHEMGFNDLAQRPILVPSTGAGNITGPGRYQYVIVYTWQDAQGVLHQSGPRITEITLASNKNVTVYVAGLGNLTQKQRVFAFLYRTSDQAAVNADPDAGFLVAIELPSNINYVSYTDTLAGSGKPPGPSPYFQDPESWPNLPPLNSAIVVAHKGRLFSGVDRPGGLSVQFSSKLGLQERNGDLINRPPEMDNQSLVTVPASLGPLRGLASYGGSLVVLCAEGIATITGDGPERDVVSSLPGGSFSDPDVANLGYGAISYMNVVVSQGVMYQSLRGIELFTGAQSQLIGNPVQNITQQHIFTNARILPSLQVVVLFSNTFEGTLVYNFTQNKWAVWTHGMWKKAIDALDLGGQLVVVPRRVQAIENILVADNRYSVIDGGVSISLSTQEPRPLPGCAMVVETPWIPPGQIMGYGQMWELIFLGEYLAPHRIQIESAANYGEYSDYKFIEDVTEIPAAGYIYRHRIPKPQVWSTRFRVTITPLGDVTNCVKLTGMMIFAGGDQGTTRLGSANSR